MLRKAAAPEGSAPQGDAPGDRARAHARIALIALTAGTASLDVTAFFRLGGVFASVMTSNLVFVGVAVVKTEAAFGTRCAVAILSYMVGVGLGSAIAPPSGHENRLGTRPLSLLLTGELAVLVGYTIWWMALDASPVGWTRLVLLGAHRPVDGQPERRRPAAGQPERRHHLPHRHPDVRGQQPGGPPPPRRRGGRRPRRPPRRRRSRAGLLDAAPVTVPLLALAGVGTTVALSWRLALTRSR